MCANFNLVELAKRDDLMSVVQRNVVDRRGRRVVFASHCLLNENVRYLGGACRAGAVDEWVDRWQASGIGICQMPCPEQRVWGGVLKCRIAPAFGARHRGLWPLRGLLLAAFVAYTRLRYALMARQTASEIRDYRRAGYEVVGLVGVAGSPTCGVRTTLDMGSWLEMVGRYRPDELDARRVNAAVVASAEPGRGLFISAVLGRLARSGTTVSLLEHDMLDELATVSDSLRGS